MVLNLTEKIALSDLIFFYSLASSAFISKELGFSVAWGSFLHVTEISISLGFF